METLEQLITGEEGEEPRRGSEEGDAVLRWLGADIVGLICHLQVSAYYRGRRSQSSVRLCVCI